MGPGDPPPAPSPEMQPEAAPPTRAGRGDKK